MAILFYLFIHSLLFFLKLVSFRWRKFTFPISFQKLFPPELILNQKKSLKSILEKGVLFFPYIILLKMTFYTGIYQKLCLDFKTVY